MVEMIEEAKAMLDKKAKIFDDTPFHFFTFGIGQGHI